MCIRDSNKADLADERQNRAWMEYFKEKGIYAVSIDSRNKGSMKAVSAAITEACKEKTERDRRRGIKNRPVRAMVAGIPNVGKSTFINTFAGKACAKTGNKPGVTKGKQWIRLNKSVELLDTPGILWPKFEDQEVGMRLAYIGSIKDDILNIEELALGLIGYLPVSYTHLNLVQDIVSILHVFSCRLYGLRKYKKQIERDVEIAKELQDGNKSVRGTESQDS